MLILHTNPNVTFMVVNKVCDLSNNGRYIPFDDIIKQFVCNCY